MSLSIPSLKGCASALLLALASVSASPQSGEAQAVSDGLRAPALGAPEPIPAAEYRTRRMAVADAMEEGVLLVVGGTSAGAPHIDYTQSPELRYLSGLTEPGVALVLHKDQGSISERVFLLPRDLAKEIWDGARLGVEGAERITGMPASPRSELPAALDSLLAAGMTLHIAGSPPTEGQLFSNLSHEQQIVSRLVEAVPALRVRSVAEVLQRLRAQKSPLELDRIRRAVHITALAHREAMRTAEPGMNEFELHALIEYTFRRHGAERPGFPSIVASGPNSTTLHYRRNDRFFEPDDLVVMDIGAAYDGYTADVTRTIPVDGSFSARQREIYEIVLAAQKAAEGLVERGATWQRLSSAADSVLGHGLARIGLIDSPGATILTNSGPVQQMRLFYMHGLGHGIGLEVHDPEASYFGPFQIGSAFTIEPGIYVREDVFDFLPDTPENRAILARLRPAVEKYSGIGVRIEDDYILTEQGAERISAGAPREIDEIESLMRADPLGASRRDPDVVEWYRGLQAN